MDLSINFDFFLNFKIDTQIHTLKLFFFVFKIILFEIRKRFAKYSNPPKPKLKPMFFFGCICLINYNLN
jgi:hypothetical protein